jgi:hypothetical protein
MESTKDTAPTEALGCILMGAWRQNGNPGLTGVWQAQRMFLTEETKEHELDTKDFDGCCLGELSLFCG